ncbi:MAG: hypothetical protein DWH91_05720 [Planctomycetota bacterium]|nr:MAG: hypothetical protein DWH91_05720 [Planctomycetota bacterium]
MHQYWVVLKVSLTRPWVWLMIFFGLFQLIPLSLFWSSQKLKENKVSIPAFDLPERVVSDHNELKTLAEQRQLSTIEGLQTHYLPGSLYFDPHGKPAGPPELLNPTSQLITLNGWPLLELLPQLKSLELEPPNALNALAWKRIGQLTQLETLSLAHIGSADAEAYKSVAQDLPAALAPLTQLRQLNINSTGGQSDWKLPPLPKLEYVVLGFNLQLEGSLETLATHSPNLHTLVLFTYPEMVYSERMLMAIRKMPRLQRMYIVSNGKAGGPDATSAQVAQLRTWLPGVAVYRGEYSLGRLGGCAFLLFQVGFISFLAWFQAGLTLAQPLAAVMPRHRRPHLFWPVAMSLVAVLVFVSGATYLGVYFPAALAIGLMASMLAALILPGHDIEPRLVPFLSIVALSDVLFLFGLIGTAAAAPALLDGFLLGDHPVLVAVLLVWIIAATGWKLVRATRLHRIQAASGMNGIPGLNVGMHQMYNQPYKPASGWSLAGWQFQRMERAIDRRLADMDRGNWVDMLRRASPSHPGMLLGIFMMVVFYTVFRMMPGMRQQTASRALPLTLGMMQASMMILMMTVMIWVGRRDSLAADFLRPIGRVQFWRALRLAILHDLKWGFLFILGWGIYSMHVRSKVGLSGFTASVTLVSALGFFAFFHGWIVLVLVSRRLWLVATLSVVSFVLAGGAAVAAPNLTQGDQADPLVAVLLVMTVVLAGSGLQWGIARKLPNWELG